MKLETGLKLLTADSALYFNGLCGGIGSCKSITTTTAEFNGIRSLRKMFFFREIQDTTNFISRIVEEKYLVPTAERALVEAVKYDDTDLGYVFESFCKYLDRNEDLTKLYEVADFYDVPRDKIGWWIKEVHEDTGD